MQWEQLLRILVLDNNHDINILGTHLENDFIDLVLKNKRLHPGLNTNIPEGINLIKYEKFDTILKCAM